MTAIARVFGVRLTPQKVKTATDLRLQAQAKRLDALSERIRDDYKRHDDRMAGRG